MLLELPNGDSFGHRKHLELKEFRVQLVLLEEKQV
jgi:hypothetical protein